MVFDGTILPSTGMAIVDGAYRGLPCPASPCPIPLCNLPRVPHSIVQLAKGVECQ